MHTPSTTRGRCLALLALAMAPAVVFAHDLFLRPTRFVVPPHSTLRIHVLNGTFSRSEGAVARNRVRDLRIGSSAGLRPLDTMLLLPRGDTALLSVPIGGQGTYAIAASLLPREITLKAGDFNEYLRTDGVPDVLAQRRASGQLNRDARERYSKHVKTIVQAGRTPGEGFEHVFDHPVELVPLDNPYSLRRGGTLRVRALLDGSPIANQYVMSGGRTRSGGRFTGRSVRTNAQGVARIPLTASGAWYVKFIHMVPVTGVDSLDYESKWATLTFEIR